MISVRGFVVSLAILCSSVQAANLSPRNTQPGFLVPYGNFDSTVPVGIQAIDVAASTNSHVVAISPSLSVIDNETYPESNVDYYGTPPNPTAVFVSAAGDHTETIRSDRTCVGWGATWHFATVGHATNYVGVATAYWHTLLINNNGKVIYQGIGPGSEVADTLNNVTQVAAGNGQSVALQANGAVAAWPSGAQPNNAISAVPASLTNVTAIASGDTHAVALKSDGTIVLWGSQTFVPPGATNIVAIAAGGRTPIAKRADNHIFVWGNGNIAFETDKVVYAFAAADDFVVFVQQDWTREPINLSALVQGSSIKLSANLNGGYHYQLQSTQDFITWQPVGGVFGAGAVNSPLNQALDNTANTFYRLVETR